MNSYENLGILIADQEGAVRQQIVSHLSEKCWVWTFDRGKGALEKLKKSQIDILISGLKLKDMAGLEFINQAKKIYPQIYVVITASASVLSKKMESLKEIASDFISKPVKEKQLTLVLKRAVDYQQLFKKKEFYQELSILDSLTNVYNRRYLDLELSREIERSKRFSHFFSFLLIDIDNFKAYNDAYGHQAGDSFLRKFAALLMTSSRIMDSVFRYGGDEFIVIFPETSKEDAANLARRIEALIRKGKFEGLEVFSGGRLSCSIGIASYPEDGLSAEALLSVADRMMYKAKKQKKD
jgi:diguanylate cyclase (GGDEF)-like protein